MNLPSIYWEYQFWVVPLRPGTEILIAELDALGFEGFEEIPEGLLAYIPDSGLIDPLLAGVTLLSNKDFRTRYERRPIEARNWNARWEQSFQPIRIGEDCVVRAPFHPPSGAIYDIEIMPKMSFGTGHHETTQLMLHALLELDMQGKKVLDMGCGTGVLAILCAMKGAEEVDAIDTDSWSYENALENAGRNGQERIRVRQGNAGLLGDSDYDIILANINRNILLKDLPAYVRALKPGGMLLLSGFYLEDLSAISEKCTHLNLKFQKNELNNRWVTAKYVF